MAGPREVPYPAARAAPLPGRAGRPNARSWLWLAVIALKVLGGVVTGTSDPPMLNSVTVPVAAVACATRTPLAFIA